MYETKNPIIGRKIKEVYGNKDGIGFLMEDDGNGGEVYQEYYAYGDCCSNSWIEHVSGVPIVIGGVIREVNDVMMNRFDEGYDDIKVYRTSIITHKGTLDIEYRNSSNGYYGGSLDTNDAIATVADTQLPKLTSDF